MDLNSNHTQTVPKVTQISAQTSIGSQTHPELPKCFFVEIRGKNKNETDETAEWCGADVAVVQLPTAFFQLDCHCQKIHITNQTTKVCNYVATSAFLAAISDCYVPMHVL